MSVSRPSSRSDGALRFLRPLAPAGHWAAVARVGRDWRDPVDTQPSRGVRVEAGCEQGPPRFFCNCFRSRERPGRWLRSVHGQARSSGVARQPSATLWSVDHVVLGVTAGFSAARIGIGFSFLRFILRCSLPSRCPLFLASGPWPPRLLGATTPRPDSQPGRAALANRRMGTSTS